MKVLLSAYACEPDKGSEPADGWMWVNQVARFHEVWVITRANNREPIERFLERQPMANVHWVYYDLPPWARFWKKRQRGVHVYYYLWQAALYFVARRLHRHINFDVVHHVTFGQYWIPSFVGLLPAPFVWGPVGGGESAPRPFCREFSPRGKRFEILRDLARGTAWLNPVMYAVARRSRLAIATTEQTASKLKRFGAKDVCVHPQFGMTPHDMEHFRDIPIRRERPFRIVSVGRLIHWKGFHLALRGFAEFHKHFPDSEYWVLSAGPESKRLKALAAKLGVAANVTFFGGFPAIQEIYAKLGECDVLAHPALHEAFGNVCLEAMAAGRPVVCLDIGGPALQVTPDTGIRVRASSPEQAVRDLAAAFARLAADPDYRIRLGEAARRRAECDFNWDAYGEWMNRVYLSTKAPADPGPSPEVVPLFREA